MKRTLKKCIPTGIFAVCLVLFAILYTLVGNTPTFSISPRLGETLSNDVAVTINDDGSLIIKEKMQIKTTAREVWKDIYFNGSEPSQSPRYDENSTATYVKVTDGNGNVIIEGDASKNHVNPSSTIQYSWRDGKTVSWGEYPSESVTPIKHGTSQCIYIYKSGGLGPVVNIEYTYTILGAAILYKDTAEINWKFATTNDMKTSNVNVKVNLPQTISNQLNPEDVYVFGHGTDEGVVDYDEANPFEIGLRSPKLKVGEEIEARILFPTELVDNNKFIDSKYGNYFAKDHIQEAIVFEQDQRDQASRDYVIQQAVIITSIVLGGVMVILTVLLFKRIYKKYLKPHPTDFYGEYYRELPAEYGPAVMGYLYRFGHVDKNDVTATLLDLIRRKYIEIDTQGQSLTDKKVNYKMILTEKPHNDLKPYEKKLIEWFFVVVAKGNELTLDQLDKFNQKEADALKYQKCNKEFNLQILQDSRKENFFESDDKPRTTSTLILIVYAIVAGVIILFGNQFTAPVIIAAGIMGLGICLASFCYSIIRHTVKGNEDYVRWIAFKKFLQEFSNIKDYPMPGIIVWEHYMVYASAFGIADLVEKQLRFKYSQLSMENQYDQSTYLRYPMFSHYYTYRILSANRIGSQTISKARAERAKSSSGGGNGRGGFGGGSSFGGGGSGMRMR